MEWKGATMTEAASTITRWGFIGSGRMATALIRGMLRAGTATSADDHRQRPVEALGRPWPPRRVCRRRVEPPGRA